MSNGKKEYKKRYERAGYKTKVKTTKAGQDRRMAGRGYTRVSSTESGQTSDKVPTKSKKDAGATIENTLKRYTAYQKKEKPPRNPKASSYRNVRGL
jgi:hypothetical protein